MAPASITYGTALSSAQLNASASVAGTFVYNPAAGSLLGAGAGQALGVVFSPADAADYTTANGSTTITVNKATPTVTWATPSSITYGTALSSTQLDATGSVPGAFVYTPSSGTVLGAGTGQTLGVVFTPTDTTDYTSANGSTTITVNTATPTVTWPTPAAITYGTALSSTQLNATANTAGTFVYSPPAGTVLNTGAGQTLSVAFTPTDATDYTTGNQSVLITVNLATLNVTSGTTIIPAGSGPGISTLQYSSITVASGATLVFNASSGSATRTLIETNSLNLGTGSILDLNNNDLDVIGGTFSTLNTLVAQGLTTGTGIISSAAINDPTHLTTLGVIQNSVDGTTTGAPLYGSGTTLGLFDKANPANTDVLIKYTYYGDTNLDGYVDGSDYINIDNGFHNKLTGWINGDFNYDNAINGSDYTVIDNAFNTETAKLSAKVSGQVSADVAKSALPSSTRYQPPALVFSDTPLFADQPLLKKHTSIGGDRTLLDSR